MAETLCEECGMATPDYDIVNSGSTDYHYRQLCSQCFNRQMARTTGHTTFEHLALEPVVMQDSRGTPHTFTFQTLLLGDILSLKAFELLDGNPSGYQFQVVGNADDEVLALLGRLIKKMRRALAVRYLDDSDHVPQIAKQTVQGRIEWDAQSRGKTPIVTIDGEAHSWADFGRMLMSFEGWQFRLDVVDPSDEL